MLSKTYFFAIIFSFLSFTLGQTGSSNCNAIIYNAVYDQESIKLNQTQEQSFNAWLCMKDFETHDEALSAGLNVGIEVFGEPLTVGGRFDNQTKTEWMNTNCNAQNQGSSQAINLETFSANISDNAVELYRICVEGSSSVAESSSREGLDCRIEAVSNTHALLNVVWNESENTNQTLPVVRYSEFIGLANSDEKLNEQNRLAPGQLIPRTGINMLLERDASSTVTMLVLETTRGNCQPMLSLPPIPQEPTSSASSVTYVIEGEMRPVFQIHTPMQTRYDPPSYRNSSCSDTKVEQFSYCLPDDATATDLEWKRLSDPRCGEQITRESPTPNRPHCRTLYITVPSCGRDWYGNCNGHGYIHWNATVIGYTSATVPGSAYQFSRDLTDEERISLDYPYDLNANAVSTSWEYNIVVKVLTPQNDVITEYTLTQSMPNISADEYTIDSLISNGTLTVTLNY